MIPCCIALGGNVGNVDESFESARTMIEADPRVGSVVMSQLHRTMPVGDNADEPFLNAAAVVLTDLAPLEFLDLLQRVELRHGRQRDLRWGLRTLDLDLIFVGDKIIDESRLQVPHPACWYRRFVLDPLVEIASDVVHPGKQLTVSELRSRLMTEPFEVIVAGSDQDSCQRSVATLSLEFPRVTFHDWAMLGQPNDVWTNATLITWIGPAPYTATPEDQRPPNSAVGFLDVTQIDSDVNSALRGVLQAATQAGISLQT